MDKKTTTTILRETIENSKAYHEQSMLVANYDKIIISIKI